MSTGCKYSSRHPLRRRKNYAFGAFLFLFCIYAWVQLSDLDGAYTPLRPLADAESEARRLLAFMTHYNYQCNVTAPQTVGNASQWPLCVSLETGLSLDGKDTKLAYTIGSGSDYVLERSLAQNYSFNVLIATRSRLPSSLLSTNGTRVVRTTVVANDPADYSRNSFTQRTLNDLFTSQGHASSRIELLRLVAPDDATVQMWDLVHFAIHDDILRNVQHLHLTVYIDKLDSDYLYDWYRTLYELFVKAGFHLYHTASHDTLCLQVTLMQSCVYFLSYVRNPGPQVYTMYPPADFGHMEQEWKRLVGYVSTPQLDCKLPEEKTSSLRFHDKSHSGTCQFDGTKDSCVALHFGRSKNAVPLSIDKNCRTTSFVPIVNTNSESTVERYELTQKQNQIRRPTESMMWNKAMDEVKSLGWLSIIEVNVPGAEFQIVEHLLASGVLQNTSQLMMYVELPDYTAAGVHPVMIRESYSRLRRIQAYGLSLFLSNPVPSCNPADVSRAASSRHSARDVSKWSNILHRCFWLGFVSK